MPKFLIVIVLFLAITLVVFSFSELQRVVLTLQQANFWFVLLAVFVEAGWAFVLGSIFHSLYVILGMKESKRRLTFLGLASTFLGVVTTTAVGGLAMFLADGRRRSHPSGKVTVVGALYLLLDYAAFFCMLAVGIVVLIRRNHFGAGEITASLILLAVAVALGAILYLAYKSPVALGRQLASAARLINRTVHPFIHREYLSEARAHEFASDVSSGLGSLPEKPRTLVIPFLLALLNKVLLAIILMLCFLAFEVPFTAGTIVGGFAITYLFIIVSPTPAGVGLVEGIMPVALRTLRVDFSQAVIITLAFRGITFWLPLAAGAVAFRALNIDMGHASRAAASAADSKLGD
ncbi:MAG TPA: lysylphosphatidylglycerol synthase transmembrane domain-containing protein [Anaerolineales bacterium]|nr:lysylphosphatidylglycerol synthase transmembrane domain-containing protein [Anaerolineales bacterium]